MAFRHVIFAPHVDDEVIGCWTLLRKAPGHCLVVYLASASKDRRAEARGAASSIGFDFKFASDDYEDEDEAIRALVRNRKCDAGGAMFWAPDPHWELHPFHKWVGATAVRECLVRSRRFGTYSTNMNAPYLMELFEEATVKRAIMDASYPSQKSLWEHDHRYFLFEGRSEWNPPV